jgi:hypothetical protein
VQKRLEQVVQPAAALGLFFLHASHTHHLSGEISLDRQR